MGFLDEDKRSEGDKKGGKLNLKENFPISY